MELEKLFAQVAATKGVSAAVAMVEARAASDDADAVMAVAMWRLWGVHGAQDERAGYALATRAAEAGLEAAMLARISLLGNGTGIAADREAALALARQWSGRSETLARQIDMVDGWREAGAAETHHETPRVITVEGFANDAVCAHIIARAGPRLQPSFVVDPATKARRPHPVRSSTGTNFAPVDEDVVIHELHRRIAGASGTDVAAGEPLHILSYEPGQQYRSHLDALPGVANQRRTTAILYLNDDFDGGATGFGRLGIRITPKKGMLLIFDNVDGEGGIERRAEHEGEPVTSGRKWVATRWIRSLPCHPWRADTMA